MDAEADARQYLEKMGAAQVRILMPHNLRSDYVPYAAKWLAEQDEAERLRNKASQASTQKAAWIAAVAAILAVVVTVLAWLFPLH
jgi:hypothetical protein